MYSFGNRENVRKCEQQVKNVFSMIFSRTQPNIRKYFLKHFLKCNQTHENIFFSEKYLFFENTFTRTKRSLKAIDWWQHNQRLDFLVLFRLTESLHNCYDNQHFFYYI